MRRTPNYRTPSLRGANAVLADPKRMESADKTKWACGRNVKAESGRPGYYDVVRVWTLKERINGKAVTVDTHRTEAEAKAWVS